MRGAGARTATTTEEAIEPARLRYRPPAIILRAIARNDRQRIALQAELKAAKRIRLEDSQSPIRTAYERGDSLLDIRRSFRLTPGQLAGMAHRGQWMRPDQPRAKDLSGAHRSAYDALRPSMSSAVATAKAVLREAGQ